jgi:UDP-2,4-diacetamido-2,4,6-trideoxy-beta-L-altropyranose hydrolase
MNNHKAQIVFRADGNSQMGLGHIIRSTALAAAIGDDYCCTLATRCKIPAILNEASSVFEKIIPLSEKPYYDEAENFSEIAPASSLVILDGYSFDTNYQQILSNTKYESFSIDDIHESHFFSKAIINHSGGLTALNYEAEPGTLFYLGPYYSLLRKPFLEAAKERRKNVDNKICFVCFGGADPKNKTLEILERKEIGDQFEYFHVVTGSAYQHQEKLIEISAARKNISLYSAIPANDLVSVMRKCSFAICSPSTVVYEYMSVGGVVYLEQIADNQHDIIQFMTNAGLAFSLKDIGARDEASINSSLAKQENYFDGRSGERFKKIFQQYFEARKMIARKANESDLEISFHWANDPLVRDQSYNQQAISLNEHRNWFYQKMNDPNCFFYIIEIDQNPVAQIRFQVEDQQALVGYLTDQTIRNRGLGTYVLSKGIEKFIADHSKSIEIVGYVKSSNIASQRSFEKLSFKREMSEEKPASLKYTMHYGG